MSKIRYFTRTYDESFYPYAWNGKRVYCMCTDRSDWNKTSSYRSIEEMYGMWTGVTEVPAKWLKLRGWPTL